MSDDTLLSPGQQSAGLSNAERTLRSLTSVNLQCSVQPCPTTPRTAVTSSGAQAMGSDTCPRAPTPRSLCWSQTWRLRCGPSTRQSCSSDRGLATPCSSLARPASSVEVGAAFVPQAYERTTICAPVAWFQFTRCADPSSAAPCNACTCMRYVAALGVRNAYAGPAALLRQLLELTPWTVPSSLICLAPLAAGLLFAQMQAHRFAAFAEIKAMMTTGMLPVLRRMSWWVRPCPRENAAHPVTVRWG